MKLHLPISIILILFLSSCGKPGMVRKTTFYDSGSLKFSGKSFISSKEHIMVETERFEDGSIKMERLKIEDFVVVLNFYESGRLKEEVRSIGEEIKFKRSYDEQGSEIEAIGEWPKKFY
jgi:hypothetical protein